MAASYPFVVDLPIGDTVLLEEEQRVRELAAQVRDEAHFQEILATCAPALAAEVERKLRPLVQFDKPIHTPVLAPTPEMGVDTPDGPVSTADFLSGVPSGDSIAKPFRINRPYDDSFGTP